MQRKARRVARGLSATAPISVRRLQIELGSQSLEVRARVLGQQQTFGWRASFRASNSPG